MYLLRLRSTSNIVKIELAQCDYVVDMTVSNQKEHDFSNDPAWTALIRVPFLDSSSPQLTRALWIPFLSNAKNRFFEYALFKRK